MVIFNQFGRFFNKNHVFMNQKQAKTQHPIHELLQKRWSPRAFDDKIIEPDKLQKLLEAARWSPSCFNDQPWCFMVGIKGDETYKKIYEALGEFNQLWTKTAPVLLISIGKKMSPRNDQPNPYYQYDVGQAMAHLTFQATYEGLYVHQMAGFSKEKAISLFEIPNDYEPLSAATIGYIGDPNILPPDLMKMEIMERKRKSIESFVFADKFGKKSNIF